MKPKFLGVLCAAVLCVILTLGLWPFHSPKNDVTWLKHANGISFGRYGTVQSSSVLKTAHGASGSIEVWVQPDHWTGATLLAFYDPGSRRVWGLHQSLSDLELESEFQNDESQTTKARWYVGDALSHSLQTKNPAFVTVTYGPDGTSVYVEGALVRTAPGFRIPPDALTGRIILGDSPRQPDSLQGQILGLAIYGVELASAQVFQHYLTWTKNGHPDITEDERNLALYLFDEQAGTVIHNRAAIGADLYIPETYTVADKIAMEPFWQEFNMSQSYWKSNLMNVVGFLPVGFVFLAYFKIARPIGKAMLVTVAVGLATSLTIEILQAFLPTRDSGTTDLITNTLGTYLGALCYRNVYPSFTKRLPWLCRLLPTEPLPEQSLTSL